MPDSKDKKDADSKDKKDDKEKPVVIDLDGIAGRVVALPVEAGHLQHLAAGADGQIYYIRRVGVRPGQGPAARGKPSLKRFDLKTREEETLAEGIDDFQLSADRKKLLYEAGGPPPPGAPLVLGIVNAGKFNKGDGALKLDAISVRVEPRAEWAQMFHEAWRINRDYFYAPNMHGADWNAMRRKYEELLPHLASRDDLDRVIRMMLSELSVGHSFLGGGERLYEPKPIPVGLLGADYEVADGRFRFKTIYGGAYWDPSLRAPLTAPGVDVKPGDFLLAVNGKEVKADSEVYRSFEATAGKRVELKVGPKADGSGARTVVVEPIADEGSLRNRAWVEGNLRKVHERTKGRVAYVYVPNTAGSGYEYFKRYFFPQADKEAIIVDERFNGGGQVADYYIELLRRPLISYWATRYGETLRSPNAVILGPKVMIIDETAGSGGDLLPWMFRKFNLGKLVGKRTWGGLVGILGFPTLMDGGMVTAPDLAIFTEEGWVVENVGVPPDIDVEQDPAAVAAGKDPQLDKAIEVVLKELAENPPPKPPARPPFPVRVRTPARTRPRRSDRQTWYPDVWSPGFSRSGRSSPSESTSPATGRGTPRKSSSEESDPGPAYSRSPRERLIRRSAGSGYPDGSVTGSRSHGDLGSNAECHGRNGESRRMRQRSYRETRRDSTLPSRDPLIRSTRRREPEGPARDTSRRREPSPSSPCSPR